MSDVGEPMTRTETSRSAFPRTERYLAQLPHGIASHPECVGRASLVRVFADSRSLRGFDWRAVHPRIAEVLRSPLHLQSWVPEAVINATALALADHLGYDDAAVVQWFHECNESLLHHPLYAALMSLSSPSTLVRLGEARWRTLHRGVGFGVSLHEKAAETTLTFPPFLYNDVIVRGQCDGFATALSMSRAKNVRHEVVRQTPRSCSFRLEWD